MNARETIQDILTGIAAMHMTEDALLVGQIMHKSDYEGLANHLDRALVHKDCPPECIEIWTAQRDAARICAQFADQMHDVHNRIRTAATNLREEGNNGMARKMGETIVHDLSKMGARDMANA